MPIEFRCQNCRYLLRTPDDAVGKSARCPQCGQVQTVTREQPASGGFHPANTPPLTVSNSATAGSPPVVPAARNPFADEPAANPYAATAQVSQPLIDPRSRVAAPAIALLVVGIISLMLNAMLLAGGVFSTAAAGAVNNEDIMTFVMFSISMVWNLVICVGAQRLFVLRNYTLAMTSSILAVVPCYCLWPVGVAFAVWGLVVLADPQVRSAFP